MTDLAKIARPAYERDDGPLGARDREFIAKESKSRLPRGKVVSRKSLLAASGGALRAIKKIAKVANRS